MEYPLFIMSVRSFSACVRYAVVELQMRRGRRHWLYAMLIFWCSGWQLSILTYNRLSVGLIYGVLTISFVLIVSVVSRKLTSIPFTVSIVNCISGIIPFAISKIYCATHILLHSKTHIMSSMSLRHNTSPVVVDYFFFYGVHEDICVCRCHSGSHRCSLCLYIIISVEFEYIIFQYQLCQIGCCVIVHVRV